MRAGASGGAPETDFVAFDIGELRGSNRRHAVLRFVGCDGERLRIDLTEASAPDLVGIACAFWSRQS